MNTVVTPTVSGSDRLQSPAADSLHALVEPIASAYEHNRSCAPAERRTLKISGGGSKDFYTEPTASNSAHAKPFERLNTAGHSGIVSYEPSELYVTVRGGTPLSELEAVLAEHHQCLAFEPPHFAAAPSGSSSHLATVGGMVAAGLSGPARAVAGSVRDHVLGLTLVNGSAEVLQFGGTVMKNVAGYDMSRLLAGSLGQLGLIAQVSLKVLPLPAAETTLCCTGLSPMSALHLLHRWGGQPLPLNASCWLPSSSDSSSSESASSESQGLLWLRLRGAKAAVQAALQSMSADAKHHGAVLHQQDAASDSSTASSDFSWLACRDQHLDFFATPADPHLALWRLSLPQTSPVLDLSALGLNSTAQCIEWQGAQRWLWAPESMAKALRALAHQLGGHATVFRRAAVPHTGDPIPRFTPPSVAVHQINQRLKAEFDPASVFYDTQGYA
jgi:glycolate oxidase FAD binding subunit